MTTTPLVSIIIPVYNDADVIADALDSCLQQSLSAIEIIVVDDASTDTTASVVEGYAARDPRVRLVRQAHNASAYQARRAGVLAAEAEHLMFLDGDDELSTDAAETALRKASQTGADLVQFGVDVVQLDGRTGGRFESRLQPKHASLKGIDILTSLFPLDRPAQGQLWRYLFRTRLIVDAYALMPADLVLPRVNDLPIAFLAIALAEHFESVPDRLYRYHFGRGGSGQRVRDLATASFYAGAIGSIDSIEGAVRAIAGQSEQADVLLATYASVRYAIIGYTTHYLADHTPSALLDEVFTELFRRAPASEVVQSTALHWPKTINTLAAHSGAIARPSRHVHSILLATNHLRTGGISGVIISQARILLDAGYRVTIAAREPGSDLSSIPQGAEFVEIPKESLGAALAAWSTACAHHEIDLVIDHQWQYSASWQTFALTARADGIATIGWSHSFAGRSLLLGLGHLGPAPRYFELLSHLVVLSPLDVAFWKLRGMPRVSYLPNPPSSLLVTAGVRTEPKLPPVGRRIELVWWGRLQQVTKRVTELLDVAEHLEHMGVDFRLRIIGPDWRDLSAARLNSLAKQRGLGTRVRAVGPLRGAALIAAIDESDLFVNTSIIEGYPLTIPEAQSRGLPVAMYDLPWLAVISGNQGIATTPWGDASALATSIATMASDPSLFVKMSSASLSAAAREVAYDFGSMYRTLVENTPLAGSPPRATTKDVEQLLDLTVLFTEQRAVTKNPPARTLNTSERASIAARRRNTPASHGMLVVAPWPHRAARKIIRLLTALPRRPRNAKILESRIKERS